LTRNPQRTCMYLWYVYKEKLTNLSEHKFEEIHSQIEDLSLKSFHDIEGKVSMHLPARHKFG